MPFVSSLICLIVLLNYACVGSGQKLGSRSKITDPYASQFTLLGVTLGKSTLNDVQRRFGDHSVVRYGEGGNAVSQICVAPQDGQAKDVFSSGPTGGWQTVTNFDIVSPGVDRSALGSLRIGDCRAGTFARAEVKTAGGLGLGLTVAQVKSVLGTPKKEDSNRLYYESLLYNETAGDSKDEAARNRDVDSSFTVISVDFRGGKAVHISVGNTNAI